MSIQCRPFVAVVVLAYIQQDLQRTNSQVQKKNLLQKRASFMPKWTVNIDSVT